MSSRRATLSTTSEDDTTSNARGPALHHDPLSNDEVLEQFYRPTQSPLSIGSTAKKPRPTHYKIICISLYNDDIEKLERLVDTLKRRGHTKANKSQLIRAALDQVDLDKVPKSH